MRPFLAAFAVLLLTAPAAAQSAASGEMAQAQQPVTGKGKVNSVDAAGRKVNLSHGAIEALKWPAMTMDFAVSPKADLGAVKPGDSVAFTLVPAARGAYVIDSIRPEK